MPTYDYECGACGHAFEQFQSITAAPLRKCPSCGKRSVKRLIGTGAGIIFRGSGFYQTDYRSESYKAAAKADSDKAGGGEKKSETKSETKVESKPAKGSGPAKD
jgi:putative FmdB family regulatory protein